MRMKFKKIVLVSFLTVYGAVFFVDAQSKETGKEKFTQEFELEINGEYRYFYDTAQFEGQASQFPAIALTPKYTIEWNKGRESINFTGFIRFDRDKNRTHADVRELYYQRAKNNWELNIGLKKVYWGVTESNHLVDIINQTDVTESFDGEEKLGQPMVQFTWSTTNYGSLDFFYLPYHRKRTFNGEKARLRFSTVIDKDAITYESAAKEWRQDLAVRWSHYIGAFDIGVSHFYGNGREPLISFDQLGNMNAFYPVINQTGVDLQATHNAFLWKLEAMYRSSKLQDFTAVVAGVEYTFSNIDGNGLDIGVLGEYLFDDRDELALSGLQSDVFFGSRIAFNDVNDTAILIGGIVDLEKSSRIFSVEASRRIGDSWKAVIEGRIFNGINSQDVFLINFREDSFLKFSISKFF